jgi:hypothetical protein
MEAEVKAMSCERFSLRQVIDLQGKISTRKAFSVSHFRLIHALFFAPK